MNGLIYKDIVLCSHGLGITLIMGTILTICLGEWLPTVLMPLLFAMVIHGVSISDCRCHWDRFAISTGISRRTLIDSKMVSGTILVFTGVVIGAVMNLAIQGGAIGTDDVWMSLIGLMMGMIAVSASIAVDFSTGHLGYSQYLFPAFMGAVFLIALSLMMGVSDLVDGDGVMAIALTVSIVALILLVTLRHIALITFESRDL